MSQPALTSSRSPWWLLPLLLTSLISGCANNKTLDNNQRFAVLVTAIAPPIVGAFPVRVTAINGREVSGGEIRLPPGQHMVQAQPLVDDSFVSHRMTTTPRPTIPLLANFESGTRYYLAALPSEADRSQMQVVVWKTKDSQLGLLKVD